MQQREQSALCYARRVCLPLRCYAADAAMSLVDVTRAIISPLRYAADIFMMLIFHAQRAAARFIDAAATLRHATPLVECCVTLMR